MNQLGNMPDGWIIPQYHFWESFQHRYIVREEGTGWRCYDPLEKKIFGRNFVTAGAACRYADGMAIKKMI